MGWMESLSGFLDVGKCNCRHHQLYTSLHFLELLFSIKFVEQRGFSNPPKLVLVLIKPLYLFWQVSGFNFFFYISQKKKQTIKY